MERLFFNPIISTLLFCTLSSVVVEINGQENPNLCAPGTISDELISQAGHLFLFCHPAPQCEILRTGAETCFDTWTTSCGSTQYIRAVREEGISAIGAIRYSVQCCQHPSINQNNLIGVSNKFLSADDSTLEGYQDGILNFISNVYAFQGGKHIVQVSKVRCR